METEKHTQGRLQVGSMHDSGERNIITPDGYFVAAAVDGLGDGVMDANARRIVACWNACYGIPTPDLEVDNARFAEMLRERITLREQRDELLSVASSFEISGPDDDGLVWLILHGHGTTGRAMFPLGQASKIAARVALRMEQDRLAAIAKVKGGAA